jgi:hypothetical protein
MTHPQNGEQHLEAIVASGLVMNIHDLELAHEMSRSIANALAFNYGTRQTWVYSSSTIEQRKFILFGNLSKPLSGAT